LLGLLQYVLGAGATLLLAPPVILFSLLDWPRAAYVPIRVWARLLHLTTGVRYRVQGLENVPTDSSYVVISNHCSYLDGPVLVLALPDPVYFIIKKELARIPLWGPTVVKAGFVAIDRADSEQARLEMRRAVEAVRSGRRILVFAEGTRSPDGHLRPFKKGGFHLAVDAQVPILPVAVNGSRGLFPKGGACILPGRIDVLVGRPIPTEGIGKERIDELMTATREAILAARCQDPEFADAPVTTNSDVESTARGNARSQANTV